MNLSYRHMQGSVPVTVLTIEGNLDGSNYTQVINQAKQLYQAGTRRLLLDLSQMPYMSSSGIVALHTIAVMLRTGRLPQSEDGWAALHAINEESSELRKEIKLFQPAERVRRTLQLSGVDRFLEICDDLETAVNSFV
ncbi:MAG: STAS domain-containing protein, partial [Anaerolineaceae bacterium]|jgi:anti-anti-sigma factor